MSEPRRTWEQRRAAHAAEAIARVKRAGAAAKASEYRDHARALPARIRAAGLGQALAFVQAKNGREGVYEDVSRWIAQRLLQKEAVDVLQELWRQDALFVRRATEEAQAYLAWLKRFAEAELDTAAGPGAAEKETS